MELVGSPCPPVTETDGPETNILGPGMIPALMRSRSARATEPGDPTLRTVVNPASTVFFALATPSMAAWASDSCMRRRMRSSPWRISPVRWVWQSMRPGRTKESERSMSWIGSSRLSDAGSAKPVMMRSMELSMMRIDIDSWGC